jgi:hypothetical protein
MKTVVSVSDQPNGGRNNTDKELTMDRLNGKLITLFDPHRLASLLGAVMLVSALAGCVVYAEPAHYHYWHGYWR